VTVSYLAMVKAAALPTVNNALALRPRTGDSLPPKTPCDGRICLAGSYA
jgi:hypothetical protein